ncbi:MAG TPA: M28 family peptidase [Isosphaeraceae bacterium]|jgi:hypothetical protein|nr:M28 family peptidase [Isosphaeraceae bacterium]
MPRAVLALTIVAAWNGPARADDGSLPRPELSRLKRHVETLASPEFAGRRGEGGKKAAEYLVAEFKALKLEPLFDGSYTQEIPGETPGRNVGARLVGNDPDLRDQWIILAAHYDHLGVRKGVLYPGADDNASGVAMVLEAARCLASATGDARPKRSVMFLGFDLEEIGLFGSRHFVRNPPVPIEKIRLFITADMISRALGGVCEPYVFVFGSEHAPGLRPWIAASTETGSKLKLGLLGTDFLILDRSDYGPFQRRRVPYLFFSTGENPRYHTPRDTPETLDYPKFEAISRLIIALLGRAAVAPTLPKWVEAPEFAADEPKAVRDVLKTLLDHRDDFKIGPTKLLLMNRALRTLDAAIARGTITADERTTVIRIAQVILFTVL